MVLLSSNVPSVPKGILLVRTIHENSERSTRVRSVGSKDQTKMAKAGVTVQVLPESIEIDLQDLEMRIREVILEIYGEVGEIRKEEKPIAFGLQALEFTFIIDESRGTDIIEEALANVDGVSSARVIDFRRAIG